VSPKECVRDFISRCDDALCGGESDPYSLMSNDVNVRVQGRTFISGDHPGLTIVRKVLVDVVAERVKAARVEVLAIISEGSRVATKLKITGETFDGKIFNPEGEPCGCIFGVEDGAIKEVILYLDNVMVETVLIGRQFVEEGT
jgi:hypothetical protein